MAKEIERKFLVEGDAYRAMSTAALPMAQGYLKSSGGVTVRVRLCGDSGFLTVKGPSNGFTRDEWEYPIPPADAREMLRLAKGRIIEKTRYLVPFDGMTWEVDEFHGYLNGLVVAEIELPSEDTHVSLPPFVGREVTGDHSYSNSHLARL